MRARMCPTRSNDDRQYTDRHFQANERGGRWRAEVNNQSARLKHRTGPNAGQGSKAQHRGLAAHLAQKRKPVLSTHIDVAAGEKEEERRGEDGVSGSLECKVSVSRANRGQP
jgi:hypothetical protein